MECTCGNKTFWRQENTQTRLWMGRLETICLDCFKVLWKEDKPMTFVDTDGKVIISVPEI